MIGILVHIDINTLFLEGDSDILLLLAKPNVLRALNFVAFAGQKK